MATEQDIDLKDVYRKAVRGWAIIFLAGILGGLVGLSASYLRVPRYEAVAVLGIGIDYGRTWPLDENTEHHVYNRVRDLLLSDETLGHAFDQLEAESELPASVSYPAELRQRIRLSDKGDRWELGASADMPDEAANLANAWADAALTDLREAMKHAWRIAELQSSLYEARCRMDLRGEDKNWSVWICAVEAAPPDPGSLQKSVLEEIELSRGIVPAMSVALIEEARPPSQPVLWGRGALILAGIAVGLLLGLAAAVAVARQWRGLPPAST